MQEGKFTPSEAIAAFEKEKAGEEPKAKSVEDYLGPPVKEDGRFKYYFLPEISYNDEGQPIIEEEGRIIVVYDFNDPELEELPEGFCYMGGTARNAVLHSLGESTLPARDQDVTGITELNPNKSAKYLHEISLKYMPDDYKEETNFNYGIKISTLQGYFSSRDFTINEVMYANGQIIATPEALVDLRDKVVRPTLYESGDKKKLGAKVVLKALRLAQELEDTYGKSEMKDIPDWQFEAENIPLFHIALQLNKAFQRGDKTAERFYLALLEAGTISQHSQHESDEKLTANNPYELAKKIRVALIESQSHAKNPKEPFLFGQADLNQVISPEDLAKDWELGEPALAGDDFDHYAKLADTYIRQKDKHGVGFDGYRQQPIKPKKIAAETEIEGPTPSSTFVEKKVHQFSSIEYALAKAKGILDQFETPIASIEEASPQAETIVKEGPYLSPDTLAKLKRKNEQFDPLPDNEGNEFYDPPKDDV